MNIVCQMNPYKKIELDPIGIPIGCNRNKIPVGILIRIPIRIPIGDPIGNPIGRNSNRNTKKIQHNYRV